MTRISAASLDSPRHNRSPATLATWLRKILDRAADDLPLLAELGGRMERETRWETDGVGRALQALHAGLTGLDLDGREPGACAALRLRMREVEVAGDAFLRASASSALALRPVLAGFRQEFAGTERVVERGAAWLQELAAGLQRRRAAAEGELAREALQVLEARASQLQRRQLLLQEASNSARNVHALADHLARTRSALEQALNVQLKRVCGALQERLAQAGPHARKELLCARSDAQMWVTQAVALLLRLQGSRDRLVREEAVLRERCARIGPEAGERGPLARIVLPQPLEEEGVAPPTGIEPVSSA